MFKFMMLFENNVLLWIQNNMRNDVLNIFFKFITKLGNLGMIWIVISLCLIINKKTRVVGCMTLIALLMSVIINNIMLKNIFARVRPYDVVPGLTSLIGKQKDYSFPSGHAGSSFAAAVVLLKCLPKKYGIWSVILAGLIAFSRLYVGVHYLTDVLAGALIGTCIAITVCTATKIILEERHNRELFL